MPLRPLRLAMLVSVGIAMPLLASRGLTAFTTDTARAQDVRRTPRQVPAVRLLDADSTSQLLVPRGTDRARIVGFIATRCVTLCAQQNGAFQQLQREILSRGWQSRIELVTVSFDPSWDTPRALRYFAIAQHPDARVWRVLTPADSTDLPALLDTFGIRVIRDGTELVHNAALHIVSPAGRLIAILPVDEPERALVQAYEAGRTTPRETSAARERNLVAPL